MLRVRRLAVVSSFLALAACAGPTAATRPEPATIQIIPSTVVQTTADAPGLVGDFRLKPGPGTDGVIRLTAGDSLILNGSNFHPATPDAPAYLIADWGEGNGNERVGCGSCRLAHAYQTAGWFTLVMTFDDGIPTSGNAAKPVSETVTVAVEGLPAPPAPSTTIIGNRPTANFVVGSVTCSTLATHLTYMLNDLDGDALSWGVTVTGGTLTGPSFGGPVASGDTFSVDFTGTPGDNTVRLDVVDTHDNHSQPTVKLGPAATCNGQVLTLIH